jgi:hypothetical protein
MRQQLITLELNYLSNELEWQVNTPSEDIYEDGESYRANEHLRFAYINPDKLNVCQGKLMLLTDIIKKIDSQITASQNYKQELVTLLKELS